MALTYKLIDLIVHLPFGYYETFKVKKKYGFSEATCCSFIIEKLGTVIEFILLPLPLLLLVAKVDQWVGNYIILVFLLVTGVAKVGILYLYPMIIMPLFASYEELPHGELRSKICQLAKSINY